MLRDNDLPLDCNKPMSRCLFTSWVWESKGSLLCSSHVFCRLSSYVSDTKWGYLNSWNIRSWNPVVFTYLSHLGPRVFFCVFFVTWPPNRVTLRPFFFQSLSYQQSISISMYPCNKTMCKEYSCKGNFSYQPSSTPLLQLQTWSQCLEKLYYSSLQHTSSWTSPVLLSFQCQFFLGNPSDWRGKSEGYMIRRLYKPQSITFPAAVAPLICLQVPFEGWIITHYTAVPSYAIPGHRNISYHPVPYTLRPSCISLEDIQLQIKWLRAKWGTKLDI